MDTTIFEQIKKINEYEQEYWSGRDLYKILGYTEYGKFIPAIERAKKACETSGNPIKDHFAGVSEMIKIATGTPKETMREVDDYRLSRYACYLIAQNGDPRKKEIALAQTYFAIQTRKQETQELLNQLMEEDRIRLTFREDIKHKNRKLFGVAKSVGVSDYANFQDAGYMGLYGGLRQKDIKTKKKLKDKDNILDFMGSEELGANIFRATQTRAKILRENITGQHVAGLAHNEVGKAIRKTIQKLGGAMPEKLPTPEHIKESKKRIKTSLKKLNTKK
ncbi:DNA damage-inducible protein D [Candidatus Microgenomates bacterium]|nr:DNA damage-inducible protein D [Candidatus Microgenomates bacterium]